jgi:arsenate reductase
MRILILCTGNSCRSQMAEGFLKSLDPGLEVFSAGTHPAPHANRHAVAVMSEVGIDISQNQPKNVDLFVAEPFDYVITVCGGAQEVCPAFTGVVKHRLHIGFDDPADAVGTPDEVIAVYRRVRDEIRAGFKAFYLEQIKGKLPDVKQDCGCEDGCCPPKKKNPFTKWIFAVIILAALGIIGFKLFCHQTPKNESCCPPGSSVLCDSTNKATGDTTKAAPCDTTKGSSCCPKK